MSIIEEDKMKNLKDSQNITHIVSEAVTEDEFQKYKVETNEGKTQIVGNSD